MINIIKNIQKLSFIEILLLIFSLLIIISLVYSYCLFKKEGFETNKEFIIKKGTNIYDDFYTNIYDMLNYNRIISDYEIGTIINSTSPNEKSIILEIGSKTGYIVNIFKEFTPNTIGIELSKNMIDKAIERYPHLKNNFLQEDPLNNQLFENNSFTHIFCLDMNFYFFEDKKLFLENCYNWLFPGGYLALQLITNPTINIKDYIVNIRSNSFPALADPNVLLRDHVKFKDFIYKPKYYMIDSNKGIFEEKFNFNNGNIRKHERDIYYMPITTILKIAKYIGFIVLKQYNLSNKNYPNNNIYILQKPN